VGSVSPICAIQSIRPAGSSSVCCFEPCCNAADQVSEIRFPGCVRLIRDKDEDEAEH
jgi:hypothetical protein